MTLSVEEIIRLFKAKGSAWYGSEPVSQLEHAAQCAMLAEAEGAPPDLVAASFLHDIGHLLAHRAHEIGFDADDAHQYMAVPFLRGAFPESVLAPIRLHVDAKRYLCFADHGYWEALSPASRHSLALQGGVFNREETDRFLAMPFSDEAVRLRRWDDRAKTPALATPALEHFAQVLRECVRVPAATE